MYIEAENQKNAVEIAKENLDQLEQEFSDSDPEIEYILDRATKSEEWMRNIFTKDGKINFKQYKKELEAEG